MSSLSDFALESDFAATGSCPIAGARHSAKTASAPGMVRFDAKETFP
jgi:hypothetical protein